MLLCFLRCKGTTFSWTAKFFSSFFVLFFSLCLFVESQNDKQKWRNNKEYALLSRLKIEGASFVYHWEAIYCLSLALGLMSFPCFSVPYAVTCCSPLLRMLRFCRSPRCSQNSIFNFSFADFCHDSAKLMRTSFGPRCSKNSIFNFPFSIYFTTFVPI